MTTIEKTIISRGDLLLIIIKEDFTNIDIMRIEKGISKDIKMIIDSMMISTKYLGTKAQGITIIILIISIMIFITE